MIPTLVNFFVLESAEHAPEHGDTNESWKQYHDWLKLPQNWNNTDLVSYITRNGQVLKGKHTDGNEYRNCNVCNSTIVKKGA